MASGLGAPALLGTVLELQNLGTPPDLQSAHKQDPQVIRGVLHNLRGAGLIHTLTPCLSWGSGLNWN